MEMTDNQANLFDDPGLLRRAVADTKKPALRPDCLVDCYDKISNLLDAIRALNHVAHGLQGRD